MIVKTTAVMTRQTGLELWQASKDATKPVRYLGEEWWIEDMPRVIGATVYIDLVRPSAPPARKG